MRSKEEIEALLLDVLPALPAELLADGEALREQLGAFPSSGELVEELASTLSLLHAHAPPVPELSLDFSDKVMAALPPAAPGEARPAGGGGRWSGWLGRAVAAAACFALGVGYARWQAAPAPQSEPPRAEREEAPTRPVPLERAPTPAPTWSEPRVFAQGPAATPRPTYVDDRALGDYAARARHVLVTLDGLDAQPDPHALHEVLVAVEANELVLRGEAILAELEVDPERPQELSRLIHGTQVILRRVRNARGPAAVTVVSTVREEVRSTGLLDAYETLLAPGPEPEATPPPIHSTGPL